MNTRSPSSVLGLGTLGKSGFGLAHVIVFAGFVVGLFVGVASCSPDYPACDKDSDCKPKEFCVGKKCQQCRDAKDCPDGTSCNAGKCSAIEGFCRDKSQCPAGQECIANRCRPCGNDGECPSGLRCNQGQCMRPQCVSDDQCPQDQECQNGFCRPGSKKGIPGLCKLESVYFDFDRATLTNEATASLGNNAATLKTGEKTVNLIGRADSRGTPEYNMALSDRRAQAVKEYLSRVGIPANRLVVVPRGELDATGSDDASWGKDRRVDSECQQ